MIEYEIREKIGDSSWRVVAWFNDLGEARKYWSQTPHGVGVEEALVQIEYSEAFEHYISADGKKSW
jgi:hypothetical protein